MSYAAATWEALGSRVQVVVTDPAALAAARTEVETEVAAIDRTCSRFRPDAELAQSTPPTVPRCASASC